MPCPETNVEGPLAYNRAASAIIPAETPVRLSATSGVNDCARSASLSEAGRALFAVSREEKRSSNDADRLRKYLARFGLSWEDVGPGQSAR